MGLLPGLLGHVVESSFGYGIGWSGGATVVNEGESLSRLGRPSRLALVLGGSGWLFVAPKVWRGVHVDYIGPTAWVRDVGVVGHGFRTRLFFTMGAVTLVSLSPRGTEGLAGGSDALLALLAVDQVQGSAVGKYCKVLSGFLALNSSVFLMKVGHSLLQLAWSSNLHDTHLLV